MSDSKILECTFYKCKTAKLTSVTKIGNKNLEITASKLIYIKPQI